MAIRFHIAITSVTKLPNDAVASQIYKPESSQSLTLLSAQHVLLETALKNRLDLILSIVEDAVRGLDSDGALQLIRTIRLAIGSDPDIVRSVSVYRLLYDHYQDSDVRAAALSEICEAVHLNTSVVHIPDDLPEAILGIGKPTTPIGSPALEQQWIRFSGMIIRARCIQVQREVLGARDNLTKEMTYWADLLSQAVSMYKVS